MTKAALVNGLCLYILLVLALVTLGKHLNVFVGVSLFLIYFMWALVGIFRSGLRVSLSEYSTVLQRVLGWLAIAVVVVVAVATLFDVKRVFFI
ncbi:MAG: hypothetical protein AB7V40_11065 [Methyloceanibacter sp.]